MWHCVLFYIMCVYCLMSIKFSMSNVCVISIHSMYGMQGVYMCVLPLVVPPTCIKDVVDLLGV